MEQQQIGNLIGVISGLTENMNRYNTYLFGGDGKPGGLIDRMARIEENMEQISKAVLANQTETNQEMDELREMIGILTKNISELTKTIDNHVNDLNKHTVKNLFLANWKNIVLLGIAVFLVLHSIATQLSLDSIIRKILGLP